MPRHSRSKKSSSSRKGEAKPAKELDADLRENGSENEGMGMSDIDEEEAALTRLLLGGDAPVKESKELDMDGIENGENGEKDVEKKDALEDLADDDLFFMDSGAGESENAMIPFGGQEEEEEGETPAWEDSDDERLTISLADNPRLRKLRTHETDDVVSGREYTRRLRKQFELLHPIPDWAQQSSRPAKRQRRSSAGSNSSFSTDEEMDLDETDPSTLPLARFLQDANSLIRSAPPAGKKQKLRPEVLDIQRTRDIPGIQHSGITSLSFHPSYPVLLSSGLASTLYMHHIAPTAHPIPNPQLTSVHIRSTPLATSCFHPSGDKIFFAGRRRYFHTWDLPSGTVQKVTRIYGHKDEQRSMERFKLSPCGRYMGLIGSGKKGGGVVNVLNASTTQWLASARIEGQNGVADFAWWHDGQGLTVVGKGGEVGEYSMSSHSFVARWIDDGSIGATVLTLGGSNGPKILGGDRWVVIGSQSGVVNIYDRRSFITSSSTSSSNETIDITERPQPTRRLEQLVTPTSNLAISPDGQILCFSSKWKRDALRLVHLPSCTVYRNWPTSSTPLGTVTSLAFSAEGNMLAVGNEQGRIRLWDIRA
ncbi:WD40-repeat-containing domain protein [Calycina marina]|uniref:WD40-repeat-containing domain protein n=1 Tax=Calycina marina TaxID=1763456 RepID=A0A9P8CIJ9_9HELO|nr:WD40-repeat-containing domain protein [Calycina marina]